MRRAPLLLQQDGVHEADLTDGGLCSAAALLAPASAPRLAHPPGAAPAAVRPWAGHQRLISSPVIARCHAAGAAAAAAAASHGRRSNVHSGGAASGAAAISAAAAAAAAAAATRLRADTGAHLWGADPPRGADGAAGAGAASAGRAARVLVLLAAARARHTQRGGRVVSGFPSSLRPSSLRPSSLRPAALERVVERGCVLSCAASLPLLSQRQAPQAEQAVQEEGGSACSWHRRQEEEVTASRPAAADACADPSGACSLAFRLQGGALHGMNLASRGGGTRRQCPGVDHESGKRKAFYQSHRGNRRRRLSAV